MRLRLPALTLALAALLASGALAAPAGAVPTPPAPVEIGAPTEPVRVFDTRAELLGWLYTNPVAEPIVASESGLVGSIDVKPQSSPLTATLSVYTNDQFALEATTGLTSVPGTGFHVGTPLGTAAISESDEERRYAFDTTFPVEAGETYWLLWTALTGPQSAPITRGWMNQTGTIYTPTGTSHGGLALSLNTASDPVSVEVTGTEGDNGWFTGAATATYTCWPTVDDCPEPATLTTDGDHTVEGAVDVDGTPFAWYHHVKIDTTKPTITGSAAQHGNGVRVTWTCTDTASGIADCPDPSYVAGFGDDTSATGTATDKAGNTTTTTVTGLAAAKHAPKVTITGVVANRTYKHGTTIKPSCTASSTVVVVSARKPVAPPSATCTGSTTKHVNKDGSVKWRYLATGVDTHPLGGTTKKSVSWTVAAKPKPTVVVNGLPSKKKNGHPVILASKSYDVSFVFRDANGKLLKGKPTWLHSVQSNKSGSKGTPWKKVNGFSKKKGAWTKAFVPGHHYKGEYRKYGVIAPDGTRHHFVVYVK